MIFAYALGGGLGHLVRLRAAAHTLAWREPITVLTASPLATDARVLPPEQFTVLAPPDALRRDRAGLRAFIDDHLERLAPERFVLDAFPAGILGELCGFSAPCPITHLARRLRWTRYRQRVDGTGPALHTALVLEPLEREHGDFLRARCERVEALTLRDPAASAPSLALPDDRPTTLVVHSGDNDERAALLSLAHADARNRSLDVHILSVGPGAEHDLFPAWPLFERVDTVVTGAGFNSVRQLRGRPVRHLILSFERALDDQRWRARQAVS